MAEGFLRELGGDDYQVFSAGTQPTEVRPLAIKVMAEAGIDISKQESKGLERYLDQSFDTVITVCDEANEACPVFTGARRRLHWSLPDPSRSTGSDDEQLLVYRQVRDAVRRRIEAMLAPPLS
jgi:arsenate reductase